MLWLLLWLLNCFWSCVSFRAQRKRNRFVPLSKFWNCGRFGEERANVTKTGKSYESSAPLASGPLLAAVTRSFPTSVVMCSSPTFSRVPCFHRPPGNQPTSQRKCKHGLCTCSRRVCTCLSSTREFRIKLPFRWKQSLSSRNLVVHIPIMARTVHRNESEFWPATEIAPTEVCIMHHPSWMLRFPSLECQIQSKEIYNTLWDRMKIVIRTSLCVWHFSVWVLSSHLPTCWAQDNGEVCRRGSQERKAQQTIQWDCVDDLKLLTKPTPDTCLIPEGRRAIRMTIRESKNVHIWLHKCVLNTEAVLCTDVFIVHIGGTLSSWSPYFSPLWPHLCAKACICAHTRICLVRLTVTIVTDL